MTPAQEEELERLTPTMWAILRYAAKYCPMAKIGGTWLDAARSLEQAGFVTLWRCVSGCDSTRLTAVGAEALTRAVATRRGG